MWIEIGGNLYYKSKQHHFMSADIKLQGVGTTFFGHCVTKNDSGRRGFLFSDQKKKKKQNDLLSRHS